MISSQWFQKYKHTLVGTVSSSKCKLMFNLSITKDKIIYN